MKSIEQMAEEDILLQRRKHRLLKELGRVVEDIMLESEKVFSICKEKNYYYPEKITDDFLQVHFDYFL